MEASLLSQDDKLCLMSHVISKRENRRCIAKVFRASALFHMNAV